MSSKVRPRQRKKPKHKPVGKDEKTHKPPEKYKRNKKEWRQ